jgi:hypothetical protein
MNKKIFAILSKKYLKLMIIGISSSIILSAYMSTENTPPGNTGSPNDDKDCSSCHKAKAKSVDGIFSSNCESKSYIPLKTYTITLKLKGNEKSKIFGFQVSPQTASGKLQGKLIITDTEQTKLAAAKYINQTAKGVEGTAEKTWTFDWTAPVKGSGAVTFYGSFLIGGKPEIVYNSTLTLQEKK